MPCRTGIKYYPAPTALRGVHRLLLLWLDPMLLPSSSYTPIDNDQRNPDQQLPTIPDTDAVASWLTSTARKYGYAADLLARDKQKQQGSGRLKGKAKNLAQNVSTKPTPSNSPVQTYTIAIKDFNWIGRVHCGLQGNPRGGSRGLCFFASPCNCCETIARW